MDKSALIAQSSSPLKSERERVESPTAASTTADFLSPGALSFSGSDFDSSPLRSEHGVSLQAKFDDVESALSQHDAIVPEGEVFEEARPVVWEAFFVNMSMFCGYAALFGLQHEIKSRFKISDDDVEMSRQFGVAVSFLYIFNLIFRFSHNIVFGWLGPRGRTYMAMTSMMAAMLIIAVEIFILDSFLMGWVMLAYAFGGVAIGSFEANFLCCLTPLGPRTKHVAITAIPVGVTSVLVGGFFAMGPPFHVSAMSIYLTVAVGVFIGVLLFAFRIPKSSGSVETNQGLKQFVS